MMKTMKKKGKRKRTSEALHPETASAVESLLDRLGKDDASGEPLETSLERVKSELGISPERDMAIVTALGGMPLERTAGILQSLLASAKDKRLVRGIRRSLYRIERRGVPLQPAGKADKDAPVLRSPLQEPARGFVSAVDSMGNRIILLTLPRQPRGLHLLQAIVSDTLGIVEFSKVETSRRGFREFYQTLTVPEQLPIVEVDPGYCRFLLEEAARLAENHGRPLPPSYGASKKELSTLERTETPPVFLLLDEEEIRANPGLLRKSGELFQIDLFSSWFLPREEVEKYARQIEEAEESRLVLNPAQKEARLQDVYKRALVELFPEERRLIYRRRLEEMAYVLFKEGQEEKARAALAASIDLRSILTGFEPNPFLLNLIIRSIYALVAQHIEQRKAEPSLIVKP